MATYAQKKAAQAYRDKKKEKGEFQHLIYATDQQWQIIKSITTVLKKINLEDLSGVEIDDNGEFIKFIYDNRD